jgi:hypothetical protein
LLDANSNLAQVPAPEPKNFVPWKSTFPIALPHLI